jgi:4'-phosphopantetheinyl transferase
LKRKAIGLSTAFGIEPIIADGNLWRKAATPMPLPPGTVQVWRASIAGIEARETVWRAALSPEELERARRFRSSERRRQFLGGRVLLRTALGACLQCEPASVSLSVEANGKPVLQETGLRSDIEVNISHSGDIALCVLARGRAVGIDVEKVVERSHLPRVARRLFTPSECAAWSALPEDQRLAGFYRCWTSKEAYLKALGDPRRSLMAGLESEADPMAPAVQVRTTGEGGRRRTWTFHSFAPAEGYLATAVAEGDALQWKFVEAFRTA